jgi:hypothetical protein
VDKKTGICKLNQITKAKIIDLPGTYSLNANSIDENVVIELLLNKNDEDFPDVAVVVTEVENLKHTGLVFQSQEGSYAKNTYFQYHIFQGFITPEQIQQSFDTFEWIKEHPKAFLRWKRDRREKDAVAWFNPKTTRLNPRWCPDILVLYLRNHK